MIKHSVLCKQTPCAYITSMHHVEVVAHGVTVHYILLPNHHSASDQLKKKYDTDSNDNP